MEELRKILTAVAAGAISPGEAERRLSSGEVRYLDEFAALDAGRERRKGVPEVVYAPGKTPEQVARICAALVSSGGRRALVSGADSGHEAAIREHLPGVPARRAGRALVIGAGEPERTGGRVGLLTAGTSDIPVAEEAAAVMEQMGCEVRGFYDVGVAGIHRLGVPLRELRSFDPDCVVVAAGMEGALPSVVAGLVDVPVVGLPTSTGYGLGGDGTAAVLSMLQTCSPGLAVVNVDNGVGAGAMAALIANRAARGRG
jgi:NCAIR mutase (PurE)-related protein